MYGYKPIMRHQYKPVVLYERKHIALCWHPMDLASASAGTPLVQLNRNR
jgi:hypothetical protein